MTHIENIPHILKYGITHRNSKNTNSDYKVIGDISLINTRNKKKIKITNGGRKTIETITLGDFIPFYFGVKMPMLYVMQHGGNFVSEPTEPENIVYIACSITKINGLGLEFYFSDGHAIDNFTIFYNKDEFHNIPDIIDWKAVKSSYWAGSGNLDIKRKKQAEFIVKNDVPASCIIGYACYNKKAFNKLTGFGINNNLIKIKPNIYF